MTDDLREAHKPSKLSFGALVPQLYEQLHLPRRSLRYLQACADGITTLALANILSEAETHRARRRLVKRIQQTFKQGQP